VHPDSTTLLSPTLPTHLTCIPGLTPSVLSFVPSKVDVAVIEVGIGGRIDATNVVLPSATGQQGKTMDCVRTICRAGASCLSPCYKGYLPQIRGLSRPNWLISTLGCR